jgi:integrase/recombinase XerD
MIHNIPVVSPLRQRMIDDMNMRKFSPKTQIGYIRAVSKLANYLKHSPAQATSEE